MEKLHSGRGLKGGRFMEEGVVALRACRNDFVGKGTGDAHRLCGESRLFWAAEGARASKTSQDMRWSAMLGKGRGKGFQGLGDQGQGQILSMSYDMPGFGCVPVDGRERIRVVFPIRKLSPTGVQACRG
eukprot:11203238-Alexandrium_andersonii.AAC.1